jgi:hypothetical protein
MAETTIPSTAGNANEQPKPPPVPNCDFYEVTECLIAEALD